VKELEAVIHNQQATIIHTPLGWVGVAATEQGISNIVLPKKDKRSVEAELGSKIGARPLEKGGRQTSRLLADAVKLLQKYFSGNRVPFDLLVDLSYYTTFQQAVWRATALIPYGETRSYAWIAMRIKKPKAVRAVGQAMGANPVPLLIP